MLDDDIKYKYHTHTQTQPNMPHTAHKSKLVSIERLNERMNELGTRDK